MIKPIIVGRVQYLKLPKSQQNILKVTEDIRRAYNAEHTYHISADKSPLAQYVKFRADVKDILKKKAKND